MRSKGIKSNYLPPTVSRHCHLRTCRDNLQRRWRWWVDEKECGSSQCNLMMNVRVKWNGGCSLKGKLDRLFKWIETLLWSGLNCLLVYCCSCCRWSAHNQGHDRLQLKRDKSGNFNLSLCIFYFFYNNIYCWKIVGGHFQPPSTSSTLKPRTETARQDDDEESERTGELLLLPLIRVQSVTPNQSAEQPCKEWWLVHTRRAIDGSTDSVAKHGTLLSWWYGQEAFQNTLFD